MVTSKFQFYVSQVSVNPDHRPNGRELSRLWSAILFNKIATLILVKICFAHVQRKRYHLVYNGYSWSATFHIWWALSKNNDTYVVCVCWILRIICFFRLLELLCSQIEYSYFILFFFSRCLHFKRHDNPFTKSFFTQIIKALLFATMKNINQRDLAFPKCFRALHFKGLLTNDVVVFWLEHKYHHSYFVCAANIFMSLNSSGNHSLCKVILWKCCCLGKNIFVSVVLNQSNFYFYLMIVNYHFT